MKVIALTQDKFALVDDHDFERVSQFKWQAYKRKNGLWHAARTVKSGGVKSTIYMHRFLMDAPPQVEVDHCDGDGLNNQRHNLRAATKRQNARNRWHRVRGSKTSQFHGVHFTAKFRRWQAHICAGAIDGKGHAKQIYLGRFLSEEEAARAYDRAALKHFGDFAKTNFPRRDYDECAA